MTLNSAGALSHDQVAERLASPAEVDPAKIPGLGGAFENTGEFVAKSLETRLDIDVNMLASGIEDTDLGSYLADGKLASVCRFDLVDWNAFVLAGLPHQTLYTCVEAFLGGDGSFEEFSEVRPPTEIELLISKLVFAEFAEAIRRVFGELASLRLEVGAPVAEIELKDVGGAERAAGVSYRFELLGREVSVQLAIPLPSLVRMKDKFSDGSAPQPAFADVVWSERFKSEVFRTAARLKAVLDGNVLTLGEIANLQVGQVLQLDSTPDSPVKIVCNGMDLMACRLGQSNGRFYLKVEQFLGADDGAEG